MTTVEARRQIRKALASLGTSVFVCKDIPLLVLMMAVALTTASAQRRHGPPPGQNRQPGWSDQRGLGNQNRGNQNAGQADHLHHDGPGLHGGDWLRRHSGLSPQEQQKALNNDPEFRKLPPDIQDRLRSRLQRFNSLPPQQQQRMLQRLDRWNHLSPAQRDRARGLFQQFRGLPEDRRQAMVQAFHSLRAFPPDQQQKMLDSPPYSNTFSDSERNIMRGMTELNLGPAHPADTGDNTPPK